MTAPDPVGPLAETRTTHRQGDGVILDGTARPYCRGCAAPWPCLPTRLADAHEEALRMPLRLAQQVQDRDETLSQWEGVRDALERWASDDETLGWMRARAILDTAPPPEDDEPGDDEPANTATPNQALAVDVITDWLSGHSALNLPQRDAAARELLDALADASLAVCAESQEPP